MLLKFPNIDVLRQALKKKLVLPALSQTAVTAGFDEEDQLWVDTSVALTRSVQADLKKLNVIAPRSCPIKLPLVLPTWAELANAQRFLLFPDLKTFHLALTNGSVPASVSQSPTTAGLDEQERLWIETPASLSQSSIKQLRKLGVQTGPKSEAKLMAQVTCWLELLPLTPDPTSTEHLEQTPVLFDLSSGDRLAQMVTEVLRLGNDRQTYRWIDESSEESSRGLLRVVGPPYYSLLRAIDRRGHGQAPVAFVERAPRVWVELGHAHALVEHIKPAPGQMLLIRPPRQWTVIEEAPFRDVYEVMEFNLPNLPVAYKEGDLDQQIKVSLSLRTGGAVEGGELWVLRDNPIEELNRFVQNSDDQLLNRLAFAVGNHKGQTTIVVRTRQSKLPPPVLVLRATAYRPFLKLPNLFLPCGKSLHPPLRRDQVRKLLAEDPAQITWLVPTDENSFTPQRLPEDAFRPLSDWIDYVLDHEKEPLQAWVQAAQFDFDPFICDEEPQSKTRKTTGSERGRGKSNSTQQDVDLSETSAFTAPARKARAEAQEEEAVEDVIEVEQTAPDVLALQQRQRELEEQFQALEGGMDVPERQNLWPELARVYAGLKNADDAGVSWLNALWPQDAPSAEWSWRWFSTETAAIEGNATGRGKGKSWVSRLNAATTRNREINGEDLDALLTMPEPTPPDLRALAAFLIWASRRNPPPQPLLDRLNPIQRFLEANEKLLPVRGVWLAWVSLVQLSKGDVLALARARDRLLERLFQNGLRPEQDLPSFLRFSGQPTSQRFRGVRQWLTHLADLAHTWVREGTQPQGRSPMNAYVDLIFAFGLARLQETDASRESLARAGTILTRENEVHQFLHQAYQYRVLQAIDGKPHGGPLPTEQLEALEKMDRMPRYVIDRLRQHARILEPNQKIDPYRHWSSRMSDLDRELAELVDVNDRTQVISRVQRLLAGLPRGAKNAEPRARILRSALDLAPRISEDFAREILEQVIPAYDALPEAKEQTALMEQAAFLEKSLGVAAHFDRHEHIRPLVTRFQALLQSQQKGERSIQTLESLAGQCFRGLRKLGMRDEITQMLGMMENVILQGQALQSVDVKQTPNWPASLRALLHVASGWFYFGQDHKAEPVLQAVRALLFRDELQQKEKTALACTYATTVGQAQVDVAQKRLEEVFQKLNSISDTYTTNAYYSLSKLDVVEHVVLSVASDDFTLGSHARRWLDDDEFIVRRRIHRDMRNLMDKH